MKYITTEQLNKWSGEQFFWKNTRAHPEAIHLVRPDTLRLDILRCVVYVKLNNGKSDITVADIPVEEFNVLPEVEVVWPD